MEKQELIIKFTDSSESFTNGVEVGRILQQTQDGKETISNCGFPIHDENIEVIKSICKQYGYDAVLGESQIIGWTSFCGIKIKSNN